MAGDKSWLDYASLGSSVALGLVGVGVAFWVSHSADRISENGLILTTATFLLDDSARRQMAGVEMVNWLTDNSVRLPKWASCLTGQIASHAAVTAPSSNAQTPPDAPASPTMRKDCVGVSIPGGPAGVAQAPPNQQVANQLFAALGGAAPRLFIEIADESQLAGAEKLRDAVQQIKLGDQSVIAPAIERVSDPPNRLELRFLKRPDEAEAKTLAGILTSRLSIQVNVKNLSDRFDGRPDVKARTYELWFPLGQAVNVVP